MPKSVLVIDAIATHRIRFAALLESARYVVATTSAVRDLPASLGAYDLILLGIPEDQPGSVVAELVDATGEADLPILCMDAKGSPLRRLVALRAGARDVLPSKSPDDLLLARVRGLIRESEVDRETNRRRAAAVSFGLAEAQAGFAERAHVMCVGRFNTLPDHLSVLTSHKVSTVVPDDRPEVAFEDSSPDIVLLDAGLGPEAIRNLLPELRDRGDLLSAPVIALYPEKDPDLAIHALALGASEVLVDTANIEEVELRINAMIAKRQRRNALRKSAEDSYELAMTDQLTGLFNRRYADIYLSNLPAQKAGSSVEYSMLIVDLDHFKSVNDVYGHATGDIVLRAVGRRLESNLRSCDLVARYGGEEFLVVLPETGQDMAEIMAERLRVAIATESVRVSDDLAIDVTVSIGVAAGCMEGTCNESAGSGSGGVASLTSGPLLRVFEAADTALYRAKNNGRDRVEVSAA